MDRRSLERLAEEGLIASAKQLVDITRWCREWCVATGDARYCILGDALHELDVWWSEHDDAGGIPTALCREIDALLRRELLAVLRADVTVATVLADELARELRRGMLPAAEWERRGWAQPLSGTGDASATTPMGAR